ADCFGECFSVRIEKLFPLFLPRRFYFGGGDVPIRSALLEHRAQVLTQFFHGRPPEEPVAHIDLVNHQAWLEDDRVWNHWIVIGIGVLGNIEILLNDAPRIGKKRPMRTDSTAKLISLSNVIGADRHQLAIADFRLAM